MRIGVDWDDTLVDAKTQEWLDGAREGLIRLMRQGHEPVIMSRRAAWAGGVTQIQTTLAAARLADIQVIEKPNVDLIVDNDALRFEGNWSDTTAEIRKLR